MIYVFNIKSWLPTLFIIISCFGLSAREHLNFNNDWAFYRGNLPDAAKPTADDRNWIPIVLPHVMQLEKKHCGGNIIYDGIGWYRRYFTLGADCQGKRIVVKFEGVMTNCEVFLNGESLTTHHGGYLGFSVDLTDKIKFGESNLLAVKVDASHDPLTPPGKPQADMDFYYYSGIYRDAEMIITDKLYITDPLDENIEAGGGVFITYPYVSDRLATVNIKTHIRSKFDKSRKVTIETLIKDVNGEIVAKDIKSTRVGGKDSKSVLQTLKVANPKLWHPCTPYLYTVTTKILSDGRVIDSLYTHSGIRTIKFDTEKGFFINGQHLYLRGANRHQAYPYIGDAAPNSMQEREVIGIRKGGFNAVRAAHYPHDPAFLDACDRYGLLVVECIPGWQYYNSDPVFSARVCEAGRQMIRRDRNHPSVVIWETALNESRYPAELADSLYQIAHREYPGDQMFTSGDYFGHEDMAPYFDILYKQVGSFPADGNVMTNIPENLVAIKPLICREWGDGVGDKPRVSIGESNKEQLRQCYSRIGQLEGEGYFDWCMLDANPNMSGHFLWSYNDYTRGSEDETMFSGAVDLNRYPKPSYFMMKSMMPVSQSEPMVYIASDNSSENDTAITVFSNADKVILYRNGEKLGVITRDDAASLYPNITAKGGSPIFRFSTDGYEKGELKAIAYSGDKEVATHTVTTPGSTHHLKIVPALEGIDPVADGSDLIPVYVIVCDENGNRVESYDSPVTLSVTGDASVVGDGIERLGINPQIPEGGVAFFFIRVGQHDEIIKISATAETLEGSTTNVAIKPCNRKFVATTDHEPFCGREEDGVVEKPSTWQQKIMRGNPLVISSINGDGPDINKIIDGDDNTWWIAPSVALPHIVTLDLGDRKWVNAARIRFQKDSSSYGHFIEISNDGNEWTPLFRRECTGWDFKPLPINRELRYIRLTVTSVSEGRAGISEITLY